MREIPSAKNLVIPALLVISIFVLQLRRSAEQIPFWKHQGLIMGTSFTVQMYHPEEVSRSTITDALEFESKQPVFSTKNQSKYTALACPISAWKPLSSQRCSITYSLQWTGPRKTSSAGDCSMACHSERSQSGKASR